MSLSVYVAAPYEDARIVCDVVHARMRKIGIKPMSRWAEQANGAENFALFDVEQLRRFAAQNDADVLGSDALLVMAKPGAGGEMFAEARFGLDRGKPIIWLGRRTLSAWRKHVVRAADLDHALEMLERMNLAHHDGQRGYLLELAAGDSAA